MQSTFSANEDVGASGHEFAVFRVELRQTLQVFLAVARHELVVSCLDRCSEICEKKIRSKIPNGSVLQHCVPSAMAVCGLVTAVQAQGGVK